MLKQTYAVLLSGFVFFSGCAAVAEHHGGMKSVPMTADSFQIVDEKHRFEKHLDRDALFLSGQGDGSFALIKGLEGQQDGVLEFDIAFPEAMGFLGVVFRMQPNFIDAEMVYVRGHKSGKPDASQYMSVYSAQEAWQLYFGAGHYSQNIMFDYGKWIPVKLAVADGLGEFYVGSMDKPKLVMPLGRTPKAGSWALYAAVTEVGAHFSNVRYSTKKPSLKSKLPKAEPTPAGTIAKWHLSAPFAEKELTGKQLSKTLKKQEWQAVEAETSGLVHVSPYHGAAMFEGKNTVFAKVNLHAEKDMVKGLDVGFSDRVKVYLNDNLLLAANDQERTRDASFLGSIGYFDTVYLPLKKGDNELWLAISEVTGGWGFKAKLEDMDGVKLK